MTSYTHEPRQRLSKHDLARLFQERDGRCHKCRRKLGPADKWIAEHVVALENGGNNDWANLALSCAWCKPSKDSDDHRQSRKGKRQAVNHCVPKEQRRSGRGFQKLPPGYRHDWAIGRARRIDERG